MPSAAPHPPAAAAPTRIPKPAEASEARRVCESTKPVVIVAVLLGAFFLMQSWIPLRSAVQIGADEGFEVAKATFCLHGHKLYSEMWNDQPPLHTWLITQILKFQRNKPPPKNLDVAAARQTAAIPTSASVRRSTETPLRFMAPMRVHWWRAETNRSRRLVTPTFQSASR